MAFARTLTQLVNKYGLSGLLVFAKIKLGLTKKVKLAGITHPIQLRPKSSDITTFKHIFAHDDYNLTISSAPETIVDAGANVGLASVYFANKYPTAKIVAVELSPTNYSLLAKNTEAYQNIETINAGLWHKNETLKFAEKGFSPWGYKVNNQLKENSISVGSITLSEIADRYNFKTIDLLKIDIEGAEVEVFHKNYDRWLPRVKTLVIEFHDRWRQNSSKTVKEAVAKYNFHETGMVGENAIFVNSNF